jgi:excinuclease UvrABC nuclease subunit
VRARLAKLVAEKRFEEAARRVGDLAALDRVDVTLAVLRRSRARNGILLAPDIEPGLVRCLAVRGGRALGWRSLPRRGDPSAAVGSLLHELVRRPENEEAGSPGPWLPADEAEAATILTAAFGGRAAGVVPIGTTPQMDSRVVLQRIAVARARVPERAPVRREDRRDWRVLQQVERPSGLRLATG